MFCFFLFIQETNIAEKTQSAINNHEIVATLVARKKTPKRILKLPFTFPSE